MNNNTYIVISSSDLGSVNFNEIEDTAIDTVRKSNDETKVVLEYVGSEPASLTGITKISENGRQYHTHSEILEVMSITGTTGWTSYEDIL